MKLFSIIGLAIGIYTLYQSLTCFGNYSRTKENIYKQAGIGILLLSVGILLIALKDFLPIPSRITYLFGFIIGITGLSIKDKARRLHSANQITTKSSNPKVLNIIIILILLFLVPLAYGIIQNYFLFNNGQVIHATVTGNVKLSTPDRYGSYTCIIYQFYENGKLIRGNATVKSVLQGRKAEEFKKGDKIDILYFNGLSVVKDNYKPNSKPGLYLILIFLAIFIWAVYKRMNCVKES